MLETIWFILWGVLWAAFFMLDGFDLGVGILLPYFGRGDNERRIVINSIGPFWDGNEVWLITAGGATFAAFPGTYATMFSTLYSPLMIILFGLILRGVSFEFRSKVDDPRWRKIWDASAVIGSFIPALLFGVAFANIFRGIPFDGEGVYHGTLITLLNPYGLLGGVLFLTMFLLHGSLWMMIKGSGKIEDRAEKLTGILWPALVVIAVAFLVASYFATDLWSNYLEAPWLFIIPLLAVAGLFGIKLFLVRKQVWKAWFSSSLFIVMATFFGVAGLYPRLFPSSMGEEFSKTIHNSSSTPLTLKIMLVVVLIFIPIVIGYQSWAYRLFSDKVTDKDLTDDESY